MKQKQYLLDTCICAYWLRDKQNRETEVSGFRFFVSGWGENEKTHIKFGFLLT